MNNTTSNIFILTSIICLYSGYNSSAQIGKVNQPYPDSTIIPGIQIINSYNFNQGLILSAAELISGKIPGLSVSSVNGRPGGQITIFNLENTSLIFGTSPLILVDEIPVIGSFLSINPNDIESITYLKAGAYTGIYGGQAANGILIINTKQGGKQLKIDYTGKFAVSEVNHKTAVFSGDSYRSLINDVYSGNPNALNMLGNSSTDWQGEIYRIAYGTDQHLSISGSPLKVPFRLSFGKSISEGTLKTSDFERTTASLSLSPTLFDNHLKIKANANGMFNNERIAEEGAVRNAILFDPTQSVRNSNGSYFQWPSYDLTPNPVAQLDLTNNQLDIKRWMWSVNIDYRLHFFNDMRVIINTGSDYENSQNKDLTDPDNLFPYMQGSGRLTRTERTLNNVKTDVYLNYSKNLNSISTIIDVTAGVSRFKSAETRKLDQTSSSDPRVIYQKSLSNGGYNQATEFGNVKIKIMDKYSLIFNLCEDGYSVFTNPKKRYFSPSISLAWDIRQESFMKNLSLISGLKLYANYGVSTVFQPYAIPDGFSTHTVSDFAPENVSSLNMGMHYSIVNDRINGDINYTDKTGKNIWSLYEVNNDNIILNRTKIGTRSIDLSMNASIISSEYLDWRVGYNLSFNKNKILELPDNYIYGISYNWIYGANGGQISILSKDYPVNSFFVNQQTYDESGKPIEGQFVNRAGTGPIYGNRANMYHYHTSSPLVLMGFSSDIKFRNWEFGFSGRVSAGNYVYNRENAMSSLNGLYRFLSGLQNTPVLINNSKFINSYLISDYYIENASFLRMDYIRLGYNIKSAGHKFNYINLAAIVQNAFVITAYKGPDPEVVSGISNYDYPRPIIASLEIKIQFTPRRSN